MGEACLALEDGRIFRGRAFGAVGEAGGEVVFNTSMAGYQEILTDPSYRGQIVVMTCPEIGNVGTNHEDEESPAPQACGFVVREAVDRPSNWRARQSLHAYLASHGIPALAEVDTRAITRHIRTRGAMRGVLSSVDRDPESLLAKARAVPPLESLDLVGQVTCRASYGWRHPRPERWRTATPAAPARRAHCVAYDFGAKRNIFRLLYEAGFDVTVVPAGLPAAEALALEPDAVFLSNGPGDPAAADYAVRTVRGLLGRVPIFGICLGHQLAGLALGGRTFKLKFGHRGANHPVLDLRTGRVAVTSQNHGYAVDPESLPPEVQVTHINLNDRTCEGFVAPAQRVWAVQYHPEASPGPHDALGMFEEFQRWVVGSVTVERDP